MKRLVLVFALGAIGFGAKAQLKIGDGGNIGIGFNSPTYKLDTRGTIRFGMWDGTWEAMRIDWDNAWGSAQIYGGSPNNLIIGKDANRVGVAYFRDLHCQYVNPVSDLRLKENIKPLSNSLERIMQISGKSYNFIDDSKDLRITPLKERITKPTIGFIAQELIEVFPELVNKPDSLSQYYTVNYNGMIPVLVEAIKEQQAIIEKMQKELESQRVALVACCNGNKTQKSMQEFNLTDPTDTDAEELKVYQNIPNPFNENTIISCHIPETVQKAELCVYDMQGSLIKCLTVKERGATTIQIQAGQLAAGIYTYLLIGDGKASDAKQMILTK